MTTFLPELILSCLALYCIADALFAWVQLRRDENRGLLAQRTMQAVNRDRIRTRAGLYRVR